MRLAIKQAYATLGLATGASEDEARAAYRKLALQFHPDKNPHAEATAKFQEISAAYKKICDFHKRGGNQSAFFFNDYDDDEDHDEDRDFDDEFGLGGMDFDELEPTFEEMLMMFEMMFAPTMASGKSKSKAGKSKKKKKKATPAAVKKSTSSSTATTPTTSSGAGESSGGTGDGAASASTGAAPAEANSSSPQPPKVAVPLGKSRRRKAPIGKSRGRGGLDDDPLAGLLDPEMMLFEQFMGMSMNGPGPDLAGMDDDMMEEMMHLFAGASDDDLFDLMGGAGRGRRKGKANGKSKTKAAATRVETSEEEVEKVEEVSDWEDDEGHEKVATMETKPAQQPADAGGNQGDDQRVRVDDKEEEPVAIGARVRVHGKLLGTVRFVGPVHYTKGDFIGVELDAPEGKNDGSLKGVAYFTCKPRHGVMVRPEDVARLAQPSPQG